MSFTQCEYMFSECISTISFIGITFHIITRILALHFKSLNEIRSTGVAKQCNNYCAQAHVVHVC